MTTKDGFPDFITEREAADLLGISRRRMEYLRATGRIPFYNFGPPRYDRKDVEEFREAEEKSRESSPAGGIARGEKNA